MFYFQSCLPSLTSFNTHLPCINELLMGFPNHFLPVFPFTFIFILLSPLKWIQEWSKKQQINWVWPNENHAYIYMNISMVIISRRIMTDRTYWQAAYSSPLTQACIGTTVYLSISSIHKMATRQAKRSKVAWKKSRRTTYSYTSPYVWQATDSALWASV